jgi:hypothetical protein
LEINMRRIGVLMAMVVLAGASAAGDGAAGDGKPRNFRFAKDTVGKVPPGWKAEQTNQGEPGAWQVVADESAPSKTGAALAQLGSKARPLFNICVAPDVTAKDLEAGVAFKAVQGKVDQGGGLVWRYQDANNYYVARMNPLEENYRLYKVVGGQRIQLATKEELDVPAGQWHRLSVKHVGKRIECFLNGKKVLESMDDGLPQAGKVGLWTKADALTYFDDLHVTPAAAKD